MAYNNDTTKRRRFKHLSEAERAVIQKLFRVRVWYKRNSQKIGQKRKLNFTRGKEKSDASNENRPFYI